jgi:hypothetical protein
VRKASCGGGEGGWGARSRKAVWRAQDLAAVPGLRPCATAAKRHHVAREAVVQVVSWAVCWKVRSPCMLGGRLAAMSCQAVQQVGLSLCCWAVWREAASPWGQVRVCLWGHAAQQRGLFDACAALHPAKGRQACGCICLSCV